MKRRKRKIKFLLVLLFLTSICLSTSTYSWFSTNTMVYIDGLNIKVQAQGGIEISTDAKNWNPVITQEDIINARENYINSINQLPLTMEPVSTGKNVSNGKLEMFYGTTENIGDKYILMATRSEETESFGEDSEGKFMAFDIFLKTMADQRLYLSSESGATYKGETPGIENSVRFAFLVQGNVSYDTNYITAQNLNNATSDTTYIWEPNFDVHTEHGIKNAKEVYGINATLNNSEQILYDGLVANITKNDKILIGDANNKNHPELFKKVNVDYLTSSNFTENVEVFNLKAGITKIRVYIWIEGQDVDCENNSAVGDIEFNFQFTTHPS